VLCLLSLWFAVSVRAQDSDQPQHAEGCKDSPLISRLPGSVIHSCETKEFEQADFPLAATNRITWRVTITTGTLPRAMAQQQGRRKGKNRRVELAQE